MAKNFRNDRKGGGGGSGRKDDKRPRGGVPALSARDKSIRSIHLPTDDQSVDDHSFTMHSGQISTEESEQLAKAETAVIFKLRMVFVTVMVLAAVGVALGVYFMMRKSEQNEFEVQFHALSTKLVGSFEEIVGQKLGAIGNFAIAYTAYARALNLTWPFVTMTDYYQRVDSARRLSDSLFIQINPIVTSKDMEEWGTFSVNNSMWITEGILNQQNKGFGYANMSLSVPWSPDGNGTLNFVLGPSGRDVLAERIWYIDPTAGWIPSSGPGPFFPIWEQNPVMPSHRNGVNYDNGAYPLYAPFLHHVVETKDAAIGIFQRAAPGDTTTDDITTNYLARIQSIATGREVYYQGDPFSTIYIPVFDSFGNDKKVVAILLATFSWAAYFDRAFPPNSDALDMVLSNTCDGSVTYRIDGDSVTFVGEGDLHSPRFKQYERVAQFSDIDDSQIVDSLGVSLNQDLCAYDIKIYPTSEFYDHYNTNLPIINSVVVGVIFSFALGMFMLYNRLVERRQHLVMTRAIQSSAIISSVFPSQVRDRLLANAADQVALLGTKSKLRSFLAGDNQMEDIKASQDDVVVYQTKAIADLFPNTTLLFADIVNFTAWSSVREPSQVFTLLETIYKAFDDIAQKRRIFKVETVGDCYVAVAGLPDNRKDHAVAMARFAHRCMNKLFTVTRRLEVLLGPDTGDLTMRMGLHTGSVTAGVLRGERARFQLFGDTMNTASRMESTGKGGMIQMTQDTADALVAAGKSAWVVPRTEKINVKGKGEMSTYWLVVRSASASVASDSDDKAPSSGDRLASLDAETLNDDDPTTITSVYKLPPSRIQRIVEWNVDILQRLIKQIVARRKAIGGGGHSSRLKTTSSDFDWFSAGAEPIGNPLDEVCEIITLPKFDARAAAKRQVDVESIVLDDKVIEQLEDFVTSIAYLYNENPFHNFEHASHVVMSVVKLLSRIVAPSEMDFENGQQAYTALHDHTYGITSDPLTQFACVISALIHDAGHTGVPNTQLIKENTTIAMHYDGKSVAEQNSVDLAWRLMLDTKYKDLRSTICANRDEMARFRQLVVNGVMATDIMDKDLKMLRNARWDKAFKEECRIEETQDAIINRKATIVIEHLIQASDVAHTMQHWHVYRRWNQRLFEEMYKAYRDGRSDKDPTDSWYKGEIGFFDFYIIPLAKKLNDCGVFGVSSDEYLNYAQQNRLEWELRGEEIVTEMTNRVHRLWGNASHGDNSDHEST